MVAMGCAEWIDPVLVGLLYPGISVYPFDGSSWRIYSRPETNVSEEAHGIAGNAAGTSCGRASPAPR